MNGLQQSQDRRNASNPPPVCFNCGVAGHFVVACPRPSREIPEGISITNAQGLNSHNQLRSTTYRPQQQHLFYSNQQCSINLDPVLQPAYSHPSSPVLTHYQTSFHTPTFHPNQYSAPQLNRPHYHSNLNYASPDYQYGLLPHQVSTSNHLYSAPNPTFHGPSPVHQSNSPGQWSFVSPSPFRHESIYRAPFSSHQKKFFKATNLKNQHSCPQASNINKKLKTQNSKVCFSVITKLSEDHTDSISNNFHGTQNAIPELEKYNKSESELIGFLVKDNIASEDEDTNYAKIDYKEDLWEWEFHAIFKEPSAVETVELAQPLAASFKSTPVPLTQAWSSLVPSISRYARKDNAKEFVRSIRCSPQWSFLQQDPAFADITDDSLLIPLHKIQALLTLRREVDKNFQDTFNNSGSKTFCHKRERSDESEKNNRNNIQFQKKDNAQCTVKEPSKKKQKHISLDPQCDPNDEKTHIISPNLRIEDNLLMGSNINEKNPKTNFSSRETGEKKHRASEVSIFAAYSRRW